MIGDAFLFCFVFLTRSLVKNALIVLLRFIGFITPFIAFITHFLFYCSVEMYNDKSVKIVEDNLILTVVIYLVLLKHLSVLRIS